MPNGVDTSLTPDDLANRLRRATPAATPAPVHPASEVKGGELDRRLRVAAAGRTTPTMTPRPPATPTPTPTPTPRAEPSATATPAAPPGPPPPQVVRKRNSTAAIQRLGLPPSGGTQST